MGDLDGGHRDAKDSKPDLGSPSSVIQGQIMRKPCLCSGPRPIVQQVDRPKDIIISICGRCHGLVEKPKLEGSDAKPNPETIAAICLMI